MRRYGFLALALLTGCCGFNRDWKRAGLAPQTTNGIAGRWDGFWLSDRNGHNGRLRCLISPSTNDLYTARYHARYWKFLTFSYSVPLKVQRSNDLFHFSGEANLGNLVGGVYRYTGSVAGTNFHSSYDSKYDHGYFRMNRVP